MYPNKYVLVPVVGMKSRCLWVPVGMGEKHAQEYRDCGTRSVRSRRLVALAGGEGIGSHLQWAAQHLPQLLQHIGAGRGLYQ